MFHKQQCMLGVDQLSSGIRTMVGLVADLAYRAVKLNAHLKQNAVLNAEGIVLIDEIDLHLHPSWQQHVIQDLQSAFQKIQFVVTTHSPQVLTTLPYECIRILTDGKVYMAPPGTEGAEASRLLKRVLGVDVRPPENQATKELNEYLDLIYADQWTSPRAIELREKLDARYQGEEPALTEADLYIENRKWELEIEKDQ
jgi:predicted ATP-binding protein involved in virulence